MLETIKKSFNLAKNNLVELEDKNIKLLELIKNKQGECVYYKNAIPEIDEEMQRIKDVAIKNQKDDSFLLKVMEEMESLERTKNSFKNGLDNSNLLLSKLYQNKNKLSELIISSQIEIKDLESKIKMAELGINPAMSQDELIKTNLMFNQLEKNDTDNIVSEELKDIENSKKLEAFKSFLIQEV